MGSRRIRPAPGVARLASGPWPWLLALGLWLGCATGGIEAPAQGRSSAWGYVTLVPRAGVPSDAAGGGYGDRRLRDVRLVDYSRPGFTVVYLDAKAPAEAGATRLAIRDGRIGPALVPRHAALGVGGRVEIHNQGSRAHLVSCPAASRVLSLDPGESASVGLDALGEYAFFLLDAPGVSSTVFAAPGRYAVAASSGRFELRDLPPGRHRLHAWHPRLPPAARWVELAPGSVHRLDVEIGVGLDAATPSRAITDPIPGTAAPEEATDAP